MISFIKLYWIELFLYILIGLLITAVLGGVVRVDEKEGTTDGS